MAPLVHSTCIALAAICYFHEAQVVAKNSSIQLRCLLGDIVPFYLDFTVYTTLYLAHGTHFHRITELCQRHGGLCQKCEFVDRFGQLNTLLGNIVQQPNFAYITQPIQQSLQVRSIFPCPVANTATGIKLNGRRATQRSAHSVNLLQTSTTLFKRWRHISSMLC